MIINIFQILKIALFSKEDSFIILANLKPFISNTKLSFKLNLLHLLNIQHFLFTYLNTSSNFLRKIFSKMFLNSSNLLLNNSNNYNNLNKILPPLKSKNNN